MRPLQVLLVDDDALVLGVLTGLLESLGHAVVSAGNAPDAELAFSVHSQVELLLSDYHLPETTGLMLAKRFTADKPEKSRARNSQRNPQPRLGFSVETNESFGACNGAGELLQPVQSRLKRRGVKIRASVWFRDAVLPAHVTRPRWLLKIDEFPIEVFRCGVGIAHIRDDRSTQRLPDDALGQTVHLQLPTARRPVSMCRPACRGG